MNLNKFKPHLLTALILAMGVSPLCAAEMTTGEKSSRIPAIMVRGLFDALSTPAEFYYTPLHESKEHPKLWPLTSVTRTGTNIFYRLGSAIYDVGFYPFAAPFVDEVPPLTEKMGLAADVWENEDEY